MTAQRIAKNHSIRSLGGLHILLLTGISIVAMGITSVRAQPATASSAGSSSQMMPAADTIPPNKVTRQDIEAAFNRADLDRDGKLNRQESEHFPAVAQQFEQIDLNRDAFISREEFGKAAGI